MRKSRVESGLLGGVDLLDRLFIENAHARASFEIDTPAQGVTLGAQFGFVSVELKGDGHLEGDVTVALKDPDTTDPDGKITVNELIDGLSDVATLIGSPEIAGEGNLTFAVSVNPSLGLIQTGTAPRATIQVLNLGDLFGRWPDSLPLSGATRVDATHLTVTGDQRENVLRGSNLTVTGGGGTVDTKIDAISYGEETGLTTLTVFDTLPTGSFSSVTAATPAAPSVRVTTSGFDDLGDFDDIGFTNILEALRSLVDFLQKFEDFEFLNEPIPLVNVSINDMLSYADDFAAALEQVAANPAATVQFLERKLEDAFNIPNDQLALQAGT